MIRQILGYIPGSIIPALIALMSTAIFTRVFETDQYGMYNLVIYTVTFIATISSQWVQQSVHRYMSVNESYQEKKAIKGVIFVSLVISIISVLVIGVLVFVLGLQGNWSELFFPGLVLAILLCIYNIAMSVLQSEMNVKKHVMFSLLSNVFKFILSLSFVFFINEDVIWLIWAYSISIMMILPLIWTKAKLPFVVEVVKDFKQNDYKSKIKNFINYGFPMTGWYLSASILSIGDRYIIEFFEGSKEVGIYSANYSLISGGVILISSPILLAAHPYLINSWNKGNRKSAKYWMETIVESFIKLGVLGSGILFVYSNDLAIIFLGESFRSGHILLPIILAGLILWQIGAYVHKPLEFEEKTKLLFILSILIGIINIILNVIFIPIFGYGAAAYSTFVSYVFYIILVHIFSRSHKLINWIKISKRVTLDVLVTIVTILSLLKFKNGIIVHMGYSSWIVISLIVTTICSGFILLRINFIKKFIQDKGRV